MKGFDFGFKYKLPSTDWGLNGKYFRFINMSNGSIDRFRVLKYNFIVPNGMLFLFSFFIKDFFYLTKLYKRVKLKRLGVLRVN